MSDTEFSGVLDLSDANVKGFEPLDSGAYACELFEWKMDKTKNPDNDPKKVPDGTPLIKLQFKITEELFENRRVFDQFTIPPATHDKDKAATMKGFLVRFLHAMGVPETETSSKKFNLIDALNSLVGEPVIAIVSQKEIPYGARKGEISNPIVGYKPISDAAALTGPASKLL